jgi:hypothetical protein
MDVSAVVTVLNIESGGSTSYEKNAFTVNGFSDAVPIVLACVFV